MKSKQKTNDQKRPYERPRLRTIEMASEEVLGIGCKLASGGTDFGDPATCVGNYCAEAGS